MNRIKMFAIALAVLFAVDFSFAQKKVQTFRVVHEINAPAEEVWAVVGGDYGAIANSHPKILRSDYVGGTLASGEGAQRVCYFNDSGTRFLKEKQVNYDPKNYSFKNQVFQAGRFPVDAEFTYAIYKVEAIDDQTSRFVFDMNFRTKPAVLGGLMKGKFKGLIADYAIAVAHYVTTGEAVNKDNFKKIKRLVAAR